APGVAVAGLTGSGTVGNYATPQTVTVDLSGVAAGTAVTLYFDLLGFGALGSQVVIDDVQMGNFPPILSLQLDPASDSGVAADHPTTLAPVPLAGAPAPPQTVLLDVDGDGFDDGQATADDSGRFTFTNVSLAEGSNHFAVSATNTAGTSQAA